MDPGSGADCLGYGDYETGCRILEEIGSLEDGIWQLRNLISGLITLSLKQILVAFSGAASALVVDIVVSSAGGNVTGSKGHPFGFGFLHEVCIECYISFLPTDHYYRISTTAATAAYMPS